MADCNTMLFKVWSPFLGGTGGGKDNLYLFLYENLHQLFDLRVHKGYIYSERQLSQILPAHSYMISQIVGVHAARSEKPESAAPAYRRGETPPAAPNHPARDYRILYIE